MRPAIQFILKDLYGNPPHQGGGVAIAAEGQTAKQLEQELKNTYGKRIERLVYSTDKTNKKPD